MEMRHRYATATKYIPVGREEIRWTRPKGQPRSIQDPPNTLNTEEVVSALIEGSYYAPLWNAVPQAM